MNKFPLLAVVSLAAMLTACVAQPHKTHVTRVDTPASVAEMLRKAEAGDIKAQEEACSEGVISKVYNPADDGDRMCEMAAAQGSIYAMVDLSARYDIGYGRPVDYKKALYWLKRAVATKPDKEDVVADTHYSEALAKMAEVNEWGLMGLKPDQRAAAKWRLKAAKSFDPISFVPLARMYEHGMGVKQDFSEAAKWYRHAGRIGYWEGAHGLTLLYLKGLGVPHDLEQAYFWNALAERLRDKDKQPRPDETYISLIVMERVSLERQLEIDQQVKDWKPDFSGF